MSNPNPTDSLEVQVVEDIFNLKDPLLISDNIEKRDYLEATPTTDSAGALNGSNTIRMSLNNTQNYLTLFDSFLKIKGKLTRSDGTTALGADDAVEHNWVAALFKRAALYIAGTKVEELSDVRIATALLGFCMKSRVQRDTYGEIEGWAPDEVKNTVKADNLGWKRRQDLFSTDDDFEVILPLSNLFGFCDVHRILYLIPIELELTRNDDDRFVFCGKNSFTTGGTATAANPKSTISKLQWLVPSITPSAERKVAIHKLLSSSNFIPMTFLRRSLHSIDMPERASWIIKTTSAHPRYLIIGFQNDDKADYTKNNSSFNHASVKAIHVDLNGSLYPKHPMKLDFATKQVVDVYNAYINFCLKNGNEPSLSLKDFMELYTIYVIDTSAQSESLRTNSILIKVEIEREASSAKCRGHALLLEDSNRMGIRVNEGVMAEFIA
jgi:hypothetical protein